MADGNSANPGDGRSVPELDALFVSAGLVRSLRGASGGVTRRMRAARERSPEELAPPRPSPVVAPNGAAILVDAGHGGRFARIAKRMIASRAEPAVAQYP